MSSCLLRSLFLFFTLVFSSVNLASAAENVCMGDIHGLALMTLKSKHVKLELEQAIQMTDDSANFVGLDDFGGEVYQMVFAPKSMSLVSGSGGFSSKKSKALKKITSLPLSQQDFLQILRAQMPDRFDLVSENDGKVIWHDIKNKKLNIVTEGSIQYKVKRQTCQLPARIDITFKKNTFSLKWISVKAVDSRPKSL